MLKKLAKRMLAMSECAGCIHLALANDKADKLHAKLEMAFASLQDSSIAYDEGCAIINQILNPEMAEKENGENNNDPS